MRFNKISSASLAAAMTLAFLAWSAPAQAEWGPPEIAVQGLLTNLADEPVEGPVDLTFVLYQGEGGAQGVWTETHLDVDLVAGHFDLVLGTVNPMDAPPVFEQFDDLWVGISVNGGPELPRAPLAAVGYAMQARHAEYCGSLTGVACQDGEILKWDGEAWDCAADDNTGYGAGWGISLDGGLITVDKTVLDAAYVEEDQENAISHEMIQAGAVSDANISDVAWNKLTGVPEGFADGVDDGLLVELDPEVGTLGQGKWCTSDGLTVNCVADQPVMAEDDPQVGQLAQGQWCTTDGTKVTCTTAPPVLAEEDPEVGVNEAQYVPVWDGTKLVKGTLKDDGNLTNSADFINEGLLDVNGTADFAETVDIHGNLDMHGKTVANVATPAAAKDAVNKDYVDNIVASQLSPVESRSKRRYTVVLNVGNSGYCPDCYTVEEVDSLKGPDNWLYVNINSHGLFMGGMNSKDYAQEYLYAGFVSTNAPSKVCSKTYTSTAGKPHVSILMPEAGDQSLCPNGYNYLPSSTTKGNNGWGYMMANQAGLYIGYVDTWARGSHDYEDNTGYLWRSYTSHVGSICFKVMGVDDDAATSKGVFPVYLGVKNENDCPAGWNVKTTSVLDSSNGYAYLQMNDNASVVGGLHDWGHGGNLYMQVHFHYSHVNFVCWNYFERDGQPYHHIRTPHAGSCPNGYTSFNADALKGWNGNGYIAAHGSGLYMGGLHSWGLHDHSEGVVRHNFTSNVNNKVCLKMEGISQ